jgi:hypothetical protein
VPVSAKSKCNFDLYGLKGALQGDRMASRVICKVDILKMRRSPREPETKIRNEKLV